MAMSYEISIAANVAAISPAVDAIMARIHQEHARAKEIEFAIETALRESLANAVLHGCKANSAMRVHCKVSCDSDGTVHITVRDPGNGFDPAALTDPLHDENLSADHGRGVYLIRKLMDEVHFADGGREVRMKKL
jgi:anti-sigma regulatory factor (Ser/Thr protein kinase)